MKGAVELVSGAVDVWNVDVGVLEVGVELGGVLEVCAVVEEGGGGSVGVEELELCAAVEEGGGGGD